MCFFSRGARTRAPCTVGTVPERPPAFAENLSGIPDVETLVSPLLTWFADHARDLPWRHTRDPYAIWVSEVMLQQTQVATVVPYWERWMRTFPDVAALARAPLERVLKLWEGLGYYTRARNLHRAARLLYREHGGQFPRDFESVRALPGVGRYTAGAICSLAFHQPTPVLDGNVARVLTRVFDLHLPLHRAGTQRRLWALAEALVGAAPEQVPPGLRRRRSWRARRVAENPCGALNEALMELGASGCTPRQPRCPDCPWADRCRARARGRAHLLPRRRRPAMAAPRRVLAWVCERHGRVLLRRRPAGGVNAGLWEFPGVPAAARTPPLRAARAALGTAVQRVDPWLTTRYTITQHRYRLEVYRVELNGRPVTLPTGCRWVGRGALERLTLTAAHRRVADLLLAGEPA